MARLSDSALASLVANYIGALAVDPITGLPARIVAYAVGRAESGGDPAVPPGDSGQSWGIWQVDLLYHPEYTAAELYNNPDADAAAMAAISQGGTVWHPWSTYRYDANLNFVGDGNGDFRNFVAEATAAFLALGGGGGTGVVAGVVTSANGQPVAGAIVTIAGFTTSTGQTGGYSIPFVPAGSYTLDAQSAGIGETTVPVTVVAGALVTANVRLPGAGQPPGQEVVTWQGTFLPWVLGASIVGAAWVYRDDLRRRLARRV